MFTGNQLLLAVLILFKKIFGWSNNCSSQSHNDLQMQNNFPEQRFNIKIEPNVQESFFVTDPLLFIEAVGDDQVFASPFGCCIQEVLLCCHPILSEECIAARLSLAQRLETTLHILSTATDGTGRRSDHGFSYAIKLTFTLFRLSIF